MKMTNGNQGKVLNKAKSNCKKSAILVIAVLLLFFCVNSVAAQEETGWQHELSLYGWFAGIDGTVLYPGAPGS